ncbi:MAG: VOC family protein [Gaiellaceae bacterium]
MYHGRAREGDNVIDHLWIRVADLEATKRFYETITPILGLQITGERDGRFHVAARDRSFALVRGEPSENVHIAFSVPDDATAGEFHSIALAAGYSDNGPPGERRYHPGYYGAFVLDPDGNNVEAVHHNR